MPRKARIADSMDIEEGVTVDPEENGHIVGIENLDASEKLELSNPVNISIENRPLEKVTASHVNTSFPHSAFARRPS
ncbi:MAG: hypothetical protein AYP45_17740 [Candidatus Brocadia carolinensis]|uniref:DUF2283 domain-containing protein n=1 Tax=Candidatus Brocadia carolinensis TaxID=1004156 RepID=A0A1V4AP74_9BACT|nr:MAG: hypothetical protein AYP45_17740 [Candidatus Brocadia caroliniensis]